MKELKTRWSEAAAKGETLSEYPRPQLKRDSFLSLNGIWQYAIAKPEKTASSAKDASKAKGALEAKATVQKICAGKILVPFCPEAPLSGVSHILQPDELLYYKRTFVLPEHFQKDRVLLHFGAVDQVCLLWLNGKYVGKHEGGYTPFTFDITCFLHDGENEIRLRVQDKTEYAPFGRGKQRLHPSGKYASLFYTPTSGIWQSVWLESVPETYITELKIDPLFDEGKVGICVRTNGELTKEASHAACVVSLHGETVLEQEIALGAGEQFLMLPDFAPWTPEQPNLYDLEVRVGEDAVKSYFGMRKIAVMPDAKGILRFFLNNEPVFLNGLLDQGYWPDGLLTAPSDEALVYDIEKLKGMGYNLIRKHVKVEPERFYYHCDRLGMLVWQDMPNGGEIYNMFFVTELPNTFDWFCRHVSDHFYGLFARKSAFGRRQYYEELEHMVTTLYNHPSIVAWVPFNEGWGQFDAKKATKLLRELDASRLVNEACGWFDQGGGDMYTIHNYRRSLHTKPQKDRVVALTEYGGYSLQVPGHMACQKSFGYKAYDTTEQLTDAYEALMQRDILSNIENGLSAAIYTQVSDIEEEINGLMTYDRAVDKMEVPRIRAINETIAARFIACAKTPSGTEK